MDWIVSPLISSPLISISIQIYAGDIASDASASITWLLYPSTAAAAACCCCTRHGGSQSTDTSPQLFLIMSAAAAAAAGIIVVYVTAPSADVADTIASDLVEQHLVACVNMTPGITSVYRWKVILYPHSCITTGNTGNCLRGFVNQQYCHPG